MASTREAIYWSWVDSNYDIPLTAEAHDIPQSSVRARVTEYLNQVVPELHSQGMNPLEILQHTRCNDLQRIISRLPAKEIPVTTYHHNQYPPKESRYSDITNQLPMAGLPDPIAIEGDCIVTGDWQLPTTDFEFMKRIFHVALLELESPRKLIICGDFLNGDAFSTHTKLLPNPSLQLEFKAGKRVLEDCLQVFDEVYICQGNHEDRVPKRTDGELNAEMIFSMMTHDSRVIISPWGHIDIISNNETYCAMHALNYSVNALKVAESMAWKEGKHIIQHHEHHLGISYDRYKNYLTINNGGLFDAKYMAYVKLRKTKHARMVNGFTMIKDGSPTLYGKYPFTNWDRIDKQIALMEVALNIREVIC